MTNDQLGKAIVNAGLMPVSDVKSLWAAIPAEQRPKDAKAFAELLIQQGKLSKFQAHELLSGTNTPLVLGDYQLQAKIGAGGMGQVFKAQHRHMKRTVAIKLLPPELTKDDGAIKRFQREVEAAAKLSHPNIVQAFDASNQRGTWYLVMEYVEGRDLAGIVAAEGSLPIARAVNYIRQAARGLGFAHENGVVHRDIKPANLLLDKKGTIKILDMGLARFDDAAAQEGLTQSGQVMGTVDYMAPEQAFDTRHADARADVYSLGCTLYRLLTAQNMYEGESLVQKLMGHQSKPIPKLSKGRPDVPAQLEAIFERMVAKDPHERYQSMAEVLTALAPFEDPNNPATAGGASGLTGLFEGLGGSTGSAALLAQPTSAQVHTSAVNPTVSLNHPLQSTDPVSARSIQIAREQTPQPGAIKRPPGNRKKLLIAAGGLGGLLAVLLGIWVIIKDKDGNEVARVVVPEGGTVEVKNGSGEKENPPSNLPKQNKLELSGGSRQLDINPIPLDATGEFTIEGTFQPSADSKRFSYFHTRGPISLGFAPDADRGEKLYAIADFPNDRVFVNTGVTLKSVAGKTVRVAMTWSADKFQAFLDGKKICDKTISKRFATPITSLTIAEGMEGIVHEVRCSNGVRYTSDYTPPTTLTADKDTIALYRLDEGSGDVLRDSSGNNHHGKIVGAKWVKLEAPSALPLTGNYALQFDGQSAHVKTPLVHDKKSPLTIEVTILPGPVRGAIIADSEGSGFGLDILNGAASFLAFRRANGNDAYSRVLAQQPLATNRAQRLAAVYDGTKLRLFIEGKLVASGDLGGEFLPSNLPFILGASPEGAGIDYPFLGTLDEVRFSKSARYTADYTPPARLEADADTWALYHFDEGTGDVLRDSSGNNHHGKIVGAKWVKLDSVVPLSQSLTTKYALDFNYEATPGQARVELPQVFDASKPMTVEMYTTLREPLKKNNRLFFSRQGGRLLSVWGKNNIEWAGANRPEGKPKFTVNNGIPIGKRTHVAAVSTSKELELFIDGKSVGKIDAPPGNGTYWADLGGLRVLDPAWSPLDGTIDDVRISTTARYASEFTPPAQLSSDKDTLIRYDFSEGSGDVLKDSSGNNHHGKIVGAKWVKLENTTKTPANLLDQGLVFDGKAHVEIPSLRFDDEQPITLEAWLQRAPISNNESQRILGWDGLLIGQIDKNGTAATLGFHSQQYVFVKGSKPPPLGQLLHMAIVWDKKNLSLYLNGELQEQKPLPKFRTADNPGIPRYRFALGCSIPIGSNILDRLEHFQGTIHAVRISSTPRYTQNFTPARRLESDKETRALYQFDEGTGDVLKDSSGNNHHGKIVGAKWVKLEGSSSPASTSPKLDLLATVDPAKDTVKGKWQLQRGILESDATLGAALQLPYKPGEEYDLEVVFSRKSGKVAALVLVKNNKQFQFDYAGWQGQVFGFGTVDGKKTNENSTTTIRPELKNGQKYTAFIQIRNGSAKAWLDGTLLSEFITDYKNVGPEEHCKFPEQTLGLLTNGEWQFHSIQLSEVKGKGTFIRPDSAQNTPRIPAKDYGLRFAGQNQYTKQTAAFNSKLAKAEPWTIEGWVSVDPAGLTERGPGYLLFFDQDYTVSARLDVSRGLIWTLQSSLGNMTFSRDTFVPNQPQHVALTYDKSTMRLYVNGKLQCERPTQYTEGNVYFNAGPSSYSATKDRIGFHGTIAEVRFSNVVRYPEAFTPPTRMTLDAATAGLYHMDEGEGNIAKDSTSTANHLEVVGAKWVTAPSSTNARTELSGPQLAALLDSSEYEWSQPEHLGANINSPQLEQFAGISADERTIYFARSIEGNNNPKVFLTAKRPQADEPFGAAEKVEVNMPASDAVISTDLLTCAVLVIPDGKRREVWWADRRTPTEPFPALQNLCPPPELDVMHPVLSADGLTLLGTRSGDVYMWTRASRGQPFANAVRLPDSINTQAWDMPGFISNDRLLTILISQVDYKAPVTRKVTYHTRARESDDFGAGKPLNIPLGPAENATTNGGFRLTGDGRSIYFSCANLPGSLGFADLWVSRLGRKGQVTNLLPLVRINQPTKSNPWKRDAQGIVIPGDGYARTQIDAALPEEYELLVEATPLSGSKSLILGMSRAGHRFWIPVSGWNSAQTKIEPLPTTGSGQKESQALRLVENQPVTLVCTVRRNGVKLVGNAQTLIDWQGDTTTLTPEWAPWVLPEPDKLALGSWEGEIRVTRLELRPLGSSSSNTGTGSWLTLFDGKTLTGWETVGEGGWSVADGVLKAAGTGKGWIGTTRNFKDYELELEYRIQANGNGGIALRAWKEGGISAKPFFEVQILDEQMIKNSDPTGSITGHVQAKPGFKAPLGEWNKVTVRLEGKHALVKFNGTTTVDADLPIERAEGLIGLQVWDRPVEYRNIRVRELNKAAPANKNAAAKTIPAHALTYGGHRYLLVDSLGNWDEAKAKAEALGGHLATINSAEERDWLRENIIAKRDARPEGVFIGGQATDDVWSWSTGEPFDKKLWLGIPAESKKGRSGLCWNSTYQWKSEWPHTPFRYLLVEWDTLGPAVSPAASVDLLPLIDPALDSVKGTWTRSGGDLSTEVVGHAVIEAPYEPPEEYDLIYEFTRTTGVSDVSVMLSRAGQAFGYCSAQGGFNYGVSLVDGNPAFTAHPEIKLENGKRYRAKVEVRRDRVAGYLDDRLVSELNTAGKTLTPYAGTKLRKNSLVGLTTYSNKATFHRLQVVELSGPGKLLRPAVGAVVPVPPPAKAPFDAATARAHQVAWSKHLGINTGTINSVGVKLILIPPGEFQMGSSAAQMESAQKVATELQLSALNTDRIKLESPQHKVLITKPFLMSSTEVTVGQFKKFVAATNYVTEAEKYGFGSLPDTELSDKVTDFHRNKNWRTPGTAVTDDSPVSQISWNDAMAFCQWLGKEEKATYRLPTEAEWEYACRAGKSTFYHFGDDHKELSKYGWYDLNSQNKPQLGGQLQPNSFGLFDMHGNMTEWCGDYYGEKWYAESPPQDPPGPATGTYRMVRGGSYLDTVSRSRSASRFSVAPTFRHYHLGFRVVRELNASPASSTSATVDPQRRAAEWVFSKGGTIELSGTTRVTDLKDLPSGQFNVTKVSLHSKGLSLEDTNLALLRDLPQLKYLSVYGSTASPEGIAGLETLPQLDRLSWGMLNLDDKAVAAIARLKHLTAFYSSGSTIRTGQLAALAQAAPNVTSLNLQNTKLKDEQSGRPLDDAAILALGGFKKLKLLQLHGTAVTAAGVAALQKALPDCVIEWDEPAKATGTLPKPWETPAFQQWLKETQALPADKQLAAVSKKLIELNPGFDGRIRKHNGDDEPEILNGNVTGIRLQLDVLRDVSPVLAFAKLQKLELVASDSKHKPFADIAPLRGLLLTHVNFSHSNVSDLSPLTGMPIVGLNIGDTLVADLSPLANSPLTRLYCGYTKITDLRPLLTCKNLTLIEGEKNAFDPAGVAALQQAVPNCIINWDGKTK